MLLVEHLSALLCFEESGASERHFVAILIQTMDNSTTRPTGRDIRSCRVESNASKRTRLMAVYIQLRNHGQGLTSFMQGWNDSYGVE